MNTSLYFSRVDLLSPTPQTVTRHADIYFLRRQRQTLEKPIKVTPKNLVGKWTVSATRRRRVASGRYKDANGHYQCFPADTRNGKFNQCDKCTRKLLKDIPGGCPKCKRGGIGQRWFWAKEEKNVLLHVMPDANVPPTTLNVYLDTAPSSQPRCFPRDVSPAHRSRGNGTSLPTPCS